VGFDDDAAWARGTARRAGGITGLTRCHVNFTGEAGDDKVRASYPPETYAKLVSIKKRYDPTNVFRLNQNIPPTAQAGWTEREGPLGPRFAESGPSGPAACSCVSGFLSYKLLGRDPGLIAR
jgi:hypothetical protein